MFRSLSLFFLITYVVSAIDIYAQITSSVRFAVIGDFGQVGQPAEDVSNLVKVMSPDFIITTGDNNYDIGAASTIDQNIGQYYYQYISPYLGSYGLGDTINRFFPSLGNHDWATAGALPYLTYFTLPGNERYYDFVRGPVHFFVIDSDPHEPDGIDSSSVQAQWLKLSMASSSSTWKIVYMHHPPFSSSSVHGSTPVLQWPFKSWGASAVLAGHDHTYERLMKDSLDYFVNGLGGKSIYAFGSPIPESKARYNSDYGAMLVVADPDSITFQFISRAYIIADQFTIRRAQQVSPQVVNTYLLKQNYPNPFNQETTILFYLPEPNRVKLDLYNILGQRVRTIANEEFEAGENRVFLDMNGFSSGIYFYSMETNNYRITRKLMYLK